MGTGLPPGYNHTTCRVAASDVSVPKQGYQPHSVPCELAAQAYKTLMAETNNEASPQAIAEVIIETYMVWILGRPSAGSTPAVPGGVEGYEKFARVLNEAFDQSAKGKGHDRHGDGTPFLDQPIMAIPRMGKIGLGGLAYQICKKAQESTTMASRNQYAAAKAELLGVIVYAVAAILHVEEESTSL